VGNCTMRDPDEDRIMKNNKGAQASAIP